MSNLRDRIAAADDLQSEIVEVPEWDNVKLEIRGMSGKARSRLMQNYVDEESGRVIPDYTRYLPDVLIACIYDPETGEPAFENTDQDREILDARSGAVIERLSDTALRLSGLTPDAVDKAGKDFSTNQKDDSSSS